MVSGAGAAVAGQVRYGDQTPDGMARRLGRLDALGISVPLADGYAEALQKVTPDDVKRVMLRYLTLRRYVVEVLGAPPTPAIPAPGDAEGAP